MSNPFFDHPILNSPYEYPKKHWELDDSGQPTQKIVDTRRRVSFIAIGLYVTHHRCEHRTLDQVGL